MPNRVIREGFLDSEKINSLKDAEQNFFIRLMLIVDDYGRYENRTELIKSRCYPVTDMRLTVVSKMLTELESVKLIVFYSVKGKMYLEIPNYNQRVRQKIEKHPSPELNDDSAMLADDNQLPAQSNPIQSKQNPIQSGKKLSLLQKAFKDFEEMRNKIKKPMTDRATQLIGIELDKLAPENEKLKIKILNQSVMKSWQGVFPLKEEYKQTNNLQPGIDVKKLQERMNYE